MPYVNIHIDVDEFYDELDRHDKKELVKYLEQDGILEQCKVVEFGDLEAKIGSPLDFEWVAMLTKLNESRYQLTPEQETALRQLVKSL
jgi:hypothetical protein